MHPNTYVDIDIFCHKREADSPFPYENYLLLQLIQYQRSYVGFKKIFQTENLNPAYALIDSNTVKAVTSSRAFAFGESDFERGTTIKTFHFEIIKLNGSWIGVGAGIQKTIVEKQPTWDCTNLGHGSYMIGSNGWTGSSTDASINHIYDNTFKFETGDIIQVTYNRDSKTLKFVKKGASGYKSLFTIPDVPCDARPCCISLSSEDIIKFY